MASITDKMTAPLDTSQWDTFLDSLAQSSKLAYTRCASDYFYFSSKKTPPLDPQDDASLFAFLHSLRKNQKFKASTLWTMLSMIGTFFVRVFNKVNPSTGKNFITDQLRQWTKDDETKKALVFSKEDVYKFIKEAPREPELLQKKVVLILGVFGLLRRSEIIALQFDHIQMRDNEVKVSIQRKKGRGPKATSTFLITDEDALAVLKDYVSLFDAVRLFVTQ